MDLEGHYLLDDDGNAVPATDLIEWAKILDNINERRVGETTFSDKTKISTVFLGLDHGIHGHVRLFETMIHFGEGGDETERWRTWKEALEGHLGFVKEHVLVHPEVRIIKNDIREKPLRGERRSVWERLRFPDSF